MTTIEQIIQRAKQGDASAQFTLAMRYEYGLTVPQSNYEACRWMAAAANNGNQLAHEKLSGYRTKVLYDLQAVCINRQPNKMAC